MEKDSMSKQIRDLREDSRRRIDTLERRNQELEADRTAMETHIKAGDKNKKVTTDQGEKIRQLEFDKNLLETQNENIESQLQKLRDQKLDVERRTESLRREIDMMGQDKTFLQRENNMMEEKVKRLEDKLDRTEMSLLESKKQAEKYMDRVLNTNDDLKLKFDQQYTNEMQDLKERYTKDLEMVKQNLIDVYETKTSHLIDRRDELDRRTTKLEKQLSDRTAAYEELMYEFRSYQKTSDEEMGILRVGARARDDEVQRVTHLYEDNMILVKETKMENESLKAKIDVLKNEYYKLESTARQGNSDIKAELAVSKERLANYELIEKELDSAIMNIAGDSAFEDDGTNAIGNALIQTITSAPTTSKRRIQQSLLLANRLQTKQKELESLQKEIAGYKATIENLEADVKLHQKLTQRTNQP